MYRGIGTWIPDATGGTYIDDASGAAVSTPISTQDLANLPNASRVSLLQEIQTIPGMVFNAAGQLVLSPTPGKPTTTDWLNTNAKTIAIVAGVGVGFLLLMKAAR